MATSLDLKIEELEKIVEQRLGLCKATTWNGARCTQPEDHEPEQPTNFQIES